jgi:hypothetical protein
MRDRYGYFVKLRQSKAMEDIYQLDDHSLPWGCDTVSASPALATAGRWHSDVQNMFGVHGRGCVTSPCEWGSA